MSTHPLVGAITPRIQYVGDGYQTAFPFPFVVFKAQDLRVYLGETLQGGGYTVAGTGIGTGGSVTFTTPPAPGLRVTLVRKVTIARLSDFQEGGAFRAKVINDDLDFITAALQELETALARAARLADPVSDGVSAILPAPQAGKAIGWSADGTRLVNDPTDFATTVHTVQAWAANADGALQQAQDSAATAQAAEAAATAQATNAAAQAAAAGTAATAATAQAGAATAAAQAVARAWQEVEALAAMTAFTAFTTRGERDAALAAATSAASAATTAEARATEALRRLEDADIALWRAERAATRAEAAAAATTTTTTTPTRPGIGPGQILPNWARLDS